MSELPTTPLELVVIDIDCLTNDHLKLLFSGANFPVGGNGETVWVRDGSIVAREITAPPSSEQALREHTRKLLEETIAQPIG